MKGIGAARGRTTRVKGSTNLTWQRHSPEPLPRAAQWPDRFLQSTTNGASLFAEWHAIRKRDATMAIRAPQRRAYLPMQKREKISPSRSSAENSPVIAASAFCASRNSSAKSSSGGGMARRGAPQQRPDEPPRRAAPPRGARARGKRPRSRSRRRRARASPPRAGRRRRRSAPTAIHACARDPPSSRCSTRAGHAGEIGLVVHDDVRQRRRKPGEQRAIGGVSSASAAARASTISSARSARSIAAHVRSMPSRSTSSAVSRKPRRVDDVQRNAVELDLPLDGVARRAGNRRDDRGLFARQAIEQARLADVRPADQHDGQPSRSRAPGLRAREQLSASRARNAPSLPDGVVRAQELDDPLRESRASPR